MSATAAIAAIKARLVASWTTTAVAWPQEGFDLPYDAAGTPLPWVFFDPDTVLSDRVGVSPVYERTGRVLLDLQCPVNIGYEAAAALRASLSAIFADQYFSGLRTEIEEDNSNSGQSEDGNYSVSYIAIRWREWSGA